MVQDNPAAVSPLELCQLIVAECCAECYQISYVAVGWGDFQKCRQFSSVEATALAFPSSCIDLADSFQGVAVHTSHRHQKI